jgi:hypothetical protein
MSEDQDCPLCLEAMSQADQLFPLHCPTATCHFNICLNCIRNMRKSEADDYVEASDGSKQVKFHVKCPSCREKYVSAEHPKHLIVPYVETIREAYEIQGLLVESDPNLSAHELRRKYDFSSSTTLSDLTDAVVNLATYVKEIAKPAYPALDMAKFDALPRSLSSTRKLDATPWRDLSLFQGLEELMTKSEQEFLTQLFCSGKPDSLCQAAHILHGMTFSTADRQAASEHRGSFSMAERKEVTKMRTRFALPARMPRCVQLPVFDPMASNRLLKFDKATDALVLQQIRGPAGRSGLRRGDVVTHIHAEAVVTQEEYAWHVRQLFQEDAQGVLMVVVNGDQETADALKERMLKMRSALKK